MHQKSFTPGIRLSAPDAVILVIGIVAAIALSIIVWWWGFVIGFVLGHFFLFCNVVRMSRPLELSRVLRSHWTVRGWLVTASVSLVVTIVLVVVETRKPSYHGFGWQRINPDLPIWWEKQ